MEEGKNKAGQAGGENNQQNYTEFLEAAAHDLHAPLRKISVLMERLIEKNKEAFDHDAKEYIRRIQGSIAEMQSLINNLSELARANSAGIVHTNCDLELIVSQIREDMAEELEEKKVDIHTSSLPVLKGDAIQYRQLFKNILENAIKFSKKDVPSKIDLNAQPITREEREQFNLNDAPYHKIIITDNGIGFHPDYAEKIFQPFIRLHAKSQYPGSGLGLSIAKKIVTNHHGIIYAAGNDSGSRFILILPENP